MEFAIFNAWIALASLNTCPWPRVALVSKRKVFLSEHLPENDASPLSTRLSCPPEPRLLYSKAQFHAFSSFVLPDPLTGRTGTEEALHTLRSGYCQPWTPMSDGL